MPPPRKEPPRKEVEVKVPYRDPVHYDLPVDAHYKWCSLLKDVEQLIQDDMDLQRKAAKGLRLKDRRLPPEVLGRFYCQYCQIINGMYDAYLRCAQIQREPYIKEIIAIVLKRMYELRNELVHFIVNDYIYVDSALAQLRLTPDDIQIVVPYHFPSESRPESVEQLCEKMLHDAWRRQIKKAKEALIEKPPTPTESEIALAQEFGRPVPGSDETKEGADGTKEGEEELVEEESESEETAASVHTEIPQDFVNIILIQQHERFRQYYVRDFNKKLETRLTYFKSDKEPEPIEVRTRASAYVAKMYRAFMELKRKRLRDNKRDTLLGLIPDMQARPLNHEEEARKLYENRRLVRERVREGYLKRIQKENARLLIFTKDAQITDITEEIVEWFHEWFLGYDKFPRFPHELEGGTVIVATGQYPTIGEQKAEDERIRRATMGKTKEQLKEERQRAREEAAMKREIEKEKAKKEKKQLFKARCNPLGDPGYDPKTSLFTKDAAELLRKYRQSWSIYDSNPPEDPAYENVVHGFLTQVLMEDVMQQLHLECRKYTDELMRLELKVFNAAHKIMCERLNIKFVKAKPKRPPKAPVGPKPFEVDDNIMKNIEKVFDLGIVSKPTARLSDVMGDFNFAAYELQTADPDVVYAPPGYGDVRRRLVLSCILGAGIEPGAVRRKAVMLLGQPRNGKTFLVDAVCGELNAVKFNISPEVFSAKMKRPARMLSYVLQAARLFQPSVIFCKNIQKVFYKKVPPEERKERAAAMRKPLGKFISGIPATEKVIFIATCSDPFNAKPRPMTSIFNEIIIVPRPDYGSIRRFLYYRLQKIFSMPRDYNVLGLAKSLQGLGFGEIIELYDKILTPERICRLNIDPLLQEEFVEYMIEKDILPMPIEQYDKIVKFWLTKSPLRAERAEYDIINATRKFVYERLAKKKAEEEAKKAAKRNKG